ncbi:MAG: hypothetical protein ACRCW1_00520 [Anaerotignaceae bacterium]
MNKINRILTITLIIITGYTTYKSYDIIKRNKVLLENNMQLNKSLIQSEQHRQDAYEDILKEYRRVERESRQHKEQVQYLEMENLHLQKEITMYKEFLQSIQNIK